MLKKLTFVFALFLHPLCQAAELLSVVKADGSTIQEIERKENLSVLNISYSEDMKNSMASSGMFSMYAACKNSKGKKCHALLATRKENKE